MNIRNRISTWFLPIAVFILCAVIMAVSVRGLPGNPHELELNSKYWMETGPFELSPERGRYALLYSFIENNTVHFSRALGEFSMPDLGYVNGNFVSLFAPAVSFIAMPGYLIGRMFHAAQVGAFATISVFSLINAMLIYAIARRFQAHPIAALLASVVFLFGSPAYAYGVSLYQHHISTFLILACMYLLISFNSLWSAFLIWFLCAAAIPIDYPNLFLLFPIGLAALRKFFPVTVEQKAIVLRASPYAFGTLLVMLIPIAFFAWFNTISYRNPLQFSGTVPTAKTYHFTQVASTSAAIETIVPESSVAAQTKPSDKNAIGFFSTRGLLNGLYILLLSPDRGVVTFTPVILLGVFGAAFALQLAQPWVTVIAGVITANLIFYGMYGDVWGGWAFGSRYLIPSYALLAILLAVWLTAMKRRWYVLLGFFLIMSYSVLVNTAGALTSSANPPQVQVLELERISGIEQKYTVMRNIDILKTRSKSFVYQTFLQKYLTSWQWYQVISGSILTLGGLLTVGLFFSRKEHTK